MIAEHAGIDHRIRARRAEESLGESQAPLREMFESLPDSVTIFDERAQLKYVNPRGLELLQAPDMNALTSSDYLALSPEDMAEWLVGHEKVLGGDSVKACYEITGMLGGRQFVEAHSVPIRLPDGSTGHMCIARDITERRLGEDALRRSEQRLRLVQDATGLAEFETGVDGLMQASDRFFAQLGLPNPERPIEARSWAKQVHPSDIDWLVQALEEAISQRSERYSGEFRIVRADTGETRWLACSTKMEYADDGTLQRTIGAHLDITERKRAEEALRASEERLRLVQDATGLAEFETTPSGISSYSDRFFEQVGLAPRSGEITFAEWSQTVHPDDRERLQQDLERLLREKECFDLEFRIVRADTGAVRWLSAHCAVKHDQAGNPVRCIGAHLDITDRKRAEEALRESEERFRLAAEAAGLGVWDYDEEDNRRQWSDRLRKILGVPEQALNLAETAERCLHPADRSKFLALTRQLGTGKIDCFEGSFRIVRAEDDRERWVTAHAMMAARTMNIASPPRS